MAPTARVTGVGGAGADTTLVRSAARRPRGTDAHSKPARADTIRARQKVAFMGLLHGQGRRVIRSGSIWTTSTGGRFDLRGGLNILQAAWSQGIATRVATRTDTSTPCRRSGRRVYHGSMVDAKREPANERLGRKVDEAAIAPKGARRQRAEIFQIYVLLATVTFFGLAVAAHFVPYFPIDLAITHLVQSEQGHVLESLMRG